MHRADQRARLGQRRPVRAAVGRREQAGVARGPAVLPVHEVNAGQVERAGQLNPPVRAAVGGRQDHVLADRPALAGRHELHSGEASRARGPAPAGCGSRAAELAGLVAGRRRARCGRARGRGGAVPASARTWRPDVAAAAADSRCRRAASLPRCTPRRSPRRQPKEGQGRATRYACPVDGGAARQVAAADANQPATGSTAARAVPRAAFSANAGITSVANSSAERSVSADVMSPKANSSEK